LDTLSKVRLDLADFRWANLSYADLRHAGLRHADLRGADFTRTRLKCARLKGALFDPEPQYVYWALGYLGNDELCRDPIAGDQKFQLDPDWKVDLPSHYVDVVVDESHVYWLDKFNQVVQRAELGTTRTDTTWGPAGTLGAGLTGIAQDKDYVYWARTPAGIWRAKKTGEGEIDSTWHIPVIGQGYATERVGQ
jgi:hypothetical protein